jgi:D-2-hydroxyacid dehydrogenase (NADP+)
MDIARIGVHDSTSIDFPFEAIQEELADVEPAIVSVDNGADCEACDAFVTFTHQESLLDADPDWIHTTQAGVDGFPLDAYEARDVVLTNSAGLHGDSVGETTVGLMLTLARRLHTFVANQQDHRWEFPAWDDGFTLTGESVCVVGLGTVGSAVARRAAALGMTVTGVRRTPDPVEGVETVYAPADLDEAIADARFVVLAVPLTDRTRGLVGREELATMSEESYLLNVARGAVVDQDALVAALRSGALAGAALDVFETEPLPPESPLWDFEDVVITPHAAVANRTFYRDVAALVQENVARLDADRTPRNRVV